MLANINLSRYRAASYHLIISAGIAAITLTVMLALWYPSPLFAAMGGMELIALIVGVDVAIGPLITLVIFDMRKKELLFDLAVIALLQVAALGYGVYTMSLARPVFMVATDLGIRVVPAVDSAAARGKSGCCRCVLRWCFFVRRSMASATRYLRVRGLRGAR